MQHREVADACRSTGTPCSPGAGYLAQLTLQSCLGQGAQQNMAIEQLLSCRVLACSMTESGRVVRVTFKGLLLMGKWARTKQATSWSKQHATGRPEDKSAARM